MHYFCRMIPNFTSSSFRLGLLGGGQLGLMLIQEAMNLNISVWVMDPDPNAPCRNYCDHFVEADFRDEAAVYSFGKQVNLLTIEIEQVNVDALLRLEQEGLAVFPQPSILAMVQDKGKQKEFYRANGIPTADFVLLNEAAEAAAYPHLLPGFLKLRQGGYDGKGVKRLNQASDADSSFKGACVLEKQIEFQKEISVIVSRNVSGQISHYPVVDMEFNPEANLVELQYCPSKLSDSVQEKAVEIARRLITKMEMIGLLAVEMFVTPDQQVLVNEIAPRPHNSGHQSIEGNYTSQFMQHLRAILGLAPGDTAPVQASVMLNLLGESGFSGEAIYQGMEEVLAQPGVYVHLYGKKLTRPFRKMGHITILSSTLEEALSTAQEIRQKIKVIS